MCRKNQAWKGYEVDGGGRRRGCTSGSVPGVCVARGGHAHRRSVEESEPSVSSVDEAPASVGTVALRGSHSYAGSSEISLRHPACIMASMSAGAGPILTESIPILKLLRHHPKAWFRADLLAG